MFRRIFGEHPRRLLHLVHGVRCCSGSHTSYKFEYRGGAFKVQTCLTSRCFFFLLWFPSSDSCLNLNFISQRARQPCAVRFDVQRLDDSILEHHRVALRAQSAQRWQIGTQLQLLGENGGRIGEHANLTAGVVLLAPGRHHERVVHGNAHDFGHAGRLEIASFVHIARQMGFGAAGGESSGHGKQNYLLAGAQIRNVDLVGRRILEQVDRWNFVTLLRGGVGEKEALGASLLRNGWRIYYLWAGYANEMIIDL